MGRSEGRVGLRAGGGARRLQAVRRTRRRPVPDQPQPQLVDRGGGGAPGSWSSTSARRSSTGGCGYSRMLSFTQRITYFRFM